VVDVRSVLRSVGQRLIAAGVPVPAPAIRLYESISSAMSRGVEVQGLPPASLRMRVAGSPDPNVFTHGGDLAVETLRDAARIAGRELDSFHSILDFGCGCGRVLRLLRHLPATRTGADVDRACIDWCSANYPTDRFILVGKTLPIPDSAVDLCYAFSVFTHLDVPSQRHWLAELHRVLMPGALLVCSTHGPACRAWLSSREAVAFDRNEIIVRLPNANTSNLCNAFHPPAAFRSLVAGHFTVLAYTDQGARGNAPQDLWVLSRTPT
jgi:SAM-dependent methyltransferase